MHWQRPKKFNLISLPHRLLAYSPQPAGNDSNWPQKRVQSTVHSKRTLNSSAWFDGFLSSLLPCSCCCCCSHCFALRLRKCNPKPRKTKNKQVELLVFLTCWSKPPTRQPPMHTCRLKLLRKMKAVCVNGNKCTHWGCPSCAEVYSQPAFRYAYFPNSSPPLPSPCGRHLFLPPAWASLVNCLWFSILLEWITMGLMSEVLGTVSIMFDWQRSRRGQVQFLYTKCKSSAIAFFNNFPLYQTRV